jgi:hypothetical protein
MEELIDSEILHSIVVKLETLSAAQSTVTKYRMINEQQI